MRARVTACTCTADPRVTGREEVVNNFQSCVFPSYISARCVHTMLALLRCRIRKRTLCSRDRLSREIGLHSDAPTVEARDSVAKKLYTCIHICMSCVGTRCFRGAFGGRGRRPTLPRNRKSTGLHSRVIERFVRLFPLDLHVTPEVC